MIGMGSAALTYVATNILINVSALRKVLLIARGLTSMIMDYGVETGNISKNDEGIRRHNFHRKACYKIAFKHGLSPRELEAAIGF